MFYNQTSPAKPKPNAAVQCKLVRKLNKIITAVMKHISNSPAGQNRQLVLNQELKLASEEHIYIFNPN